MVERGDHALSRARTTATFHAPELTADLQVARLGPDAAHHARVRRLSTGEVVRLSSGAGAIGTARILRVSRDELEVGIERIETVERGLSIHLHVPVGDRERMLLLAEKATELGIARWQPVLFQRSRSVSPRGEGEAFARKVRARMIAALEQSGGAWLPEIGVEIEVEDVLTRERDSARFLLDASGEPILARAGGTAAAVIFGPEGGLEDDEREALIGAGWLPVSLGGNTLRFETAGIAAVATLQAAYRSSARDSERRFSGHR